ncbi:endonuclease/exonuclease/phosphatase family protein [Oceaniglobus indicus]|uniref:endonuclease/exonuclease/phosphatase family protein n=1 Tax=Oceaniglobus indicus TaxID=2047749 RepID=UPI000C19EC2B|nr:endonuclease/exonuclease/phosphatase family protein [Oceaniglobus indicus]
MIRTPLTIVSWNIRKAVGLDWRRDPDRVLHVLATLDPDIVLLQEADKRLAPRHPALPLDMVDRAGWTAINADPATPSIGHHGNAVLLRHGLHIERILGIDLPGLEPRGAVLARIEGSFGALTVGGLHLGLRRSDRRQQIARVIAEAEGFGGPTVLAGDTNEWRHPGPFDLPQGWQDIAPGASFHATRPMLRLDRFLVSGDVPVRSSDVLPRSDAYRASDHLPIRLCIGA